MTRSCWGNDFELRLILSPAGEGKVPGVIYGGKQEPSLIALEPRAVLRELHRAGWQSRLYELNTGDAPVRALIRGVQFHPVTDAPVHVDFQRLVAGERVKVQVPVHFENDGISPGLKRGGVLNVVRHAVEVYCEADNIPVTSSSAVTRLWVHR